MAAMFAFAFASDDLAQTDLATEDASRASADEQIENDDSNGGGQFADINGARIYYQMTGKDSR
jgi:hypothetical protein